MGLSTQKTCTFTCKCNNEVDVKRFLAERLENPVGLFLRKAVMGILCTKVECLMPLDNSLFADFMRSLERHCNVTRNLAKIDSHKFSLATSCTISTGVQKLSNVQMAKREYQTSDVLNKIVKGCGSQYY